MIARYMLRFASVMLLTIFLIFEPSAGGVAVAEAGEVKVAVASNFLKPLEKLAKSFGNSSGHSVIISAGSTGKLYAQIVRGAPFEVFLAANAREPERLEQEGMTVPGSRFTYALGKLILWSAKPGIAPKDSLITDQYDRIALANPKLAPYGKAALQVLDRLGIAGNAREKLITGETVSQVHQFAAAGNVDFGFIALSQLALLKDNKKGSVWIVPDDLYDPIKQQAVLLNRGESNPAAKAFLAFMESGFARDEIGKLGYGMEP